MMFAMHGGVSNFGSPPGLLSRSRLWGQVAVIALAAIGCTGNAQVRIQAYLESGDAYRAQSKYAEAIIEYANAVQS